MKIGIIGAGNIGGTIAAKLAKSGHDIKLAAAEGPEFIRERAGEIGAEPAEVLDAGIGADVLILSIPFSAMPDVAAAVARTAPETVVIDTSNYYPFRDGENADLDAGKPESIWTSEQIGRPVIKTFNAALAFTLAERGKPEGSPGRLAMPVAGDDPRGKQIASGLVNEAGFDPVDSGSLADSWRQQPGTPAYCTELSAADLRVALGAAVVGKGAVNREALMKEFMSSGTFPDHDTIIRRNREGTANN